MNFMKHLSVAFQDEKSSKHQNSDFCNLLITSINAHTVFCGKVEHCHFISLLSSDGLIFWDGAS